MALYAPFGNGNLWRNIDDTTDTNYGQVAIVGGKRKLVVGDQVGELCLVGGKRRYKIEESFIPGWKPIIITYKGRKFYYEETGYRHTGYIGNYFDIPSQDMIYRSIFRIYVLNWQDGVIDAYSADRTYSHCGTSSCWGSKKILRAGKNFAYTDDKCEERTYSDEPDGCHCDTTVCSIPSDYYNSATYKSADCYSSISVVRNTDSQPWTFTYTVDGGKIIECTIPNNYETF